MVVQMALVSTLLIIFSTLKVLTLCGFLDSLGDSWPSEGDSCRKETQMFNRSQTARMPTSLRTVALKALSGRTQWHDRVWMTVALLVFLHELEPGSILHFQVICTHQTFSPLLNKSPDHKRGCFSSHHYKIHKICSSPFILRETKNISFFFQK
jgi:hypothetical protein